jgi:transmembrane sensor
MHKEPAVIHETDAAWLLDEVAVLRSRGEYAEAVRLLDKGLSGIVLPATRERFSYELGSILTYQLHDADAACRQWAKHEAAFPNGRYARELKSAKEHLKCAR